MIRNALKLDGHTCEEAEDGLEAVSRLLSDGHDRDCDRHCDHAADAPGKVVCSPPSSPPIWALSNPSYLIQVDAVGKISHHGVFDVVLMDNHMPRMNGTAATEEMRRHGYTGVVIGITGDDDDVTRQEFLTAGANACLVKPISHDALVTCLAQHVGKGPWRMDK